MRSGLDIYPVYKSFKYKNFEIKKYLIVWNILVQYGIGLYWKNHVLANLSEQISSNLVSECPNFMMFLNGYNIKVFLHWNLNRIEIDSANFYTNI